MPEKSVGIDGKFVSNESFGEAEQLGEMQMANQLTTNDSQTKCLFEMTI